MKSAASGSLGKISCLGSYTIKIEDRFLAPLILISFILYLDTYTLGMAVYEDCRIGITRVVMDRQPRLLDSPSGKLTVARTSCYGSAKGRVPSYILLHEYFGIGGALRWLPRSTNNSAGAHAYDMLCYMG